MGSTSAGKYNVRVNLLSGSVLQSQTVPNNSADASNGTGTGSRVAYARKSAGPIFLVSKGTNSTETSEIQPDIALGHELIHAGRALAGVKAPAVGKGGCEANPAACGENAYTSPNGRANAETVDKEELQTVGLVKENRFGITENGLRREQGMPERAKYGPCRGEACR